MGGSTAALELLVTLQDKASEGLDKVKEKGGGIAGMFSSIPGPGLLAGAAIGVVGGFLAESVKKAGEAETSFAELDNTLKNNAKGWDGNKSSIEEYVNTQKLAGFSTADVAQSLGNLSMTTKDLGKAEGDLSIAEDLARSRHIDLATAAKLVGKASLDNVGALKKLGIEVDKNATSEQLLAIVHNATAGAAVEYSNTSAGAMDKLGAVFDNFMESVGNKILPAITAGLSGLADFVASPGFQGAITTVMDMIGTDISFVGTAVQVVLPYIMPFVNAIGTFISTVTSGGDIGAALGKMFGGLGAAIGGLLGQLGAALPGIMDQLGKWASAFISWIGPLIPVWLAALGTLLSNLWTWFTGALPGILAQLWQWAQAFMNWILPMIPPFLGFLGQLIISLLTWLAQQIPPILAQLFQWAQAFVSWILPLIPIWLADLGTMLTNLWNWFTAALPGILQQLGQWIGAFLGWILPMIPPLLGFLGTLLWNVISWLVTSLPGIIGTLVGWVGAFLGWILPMIPQLLLNLGGMLLSLGGWLINTALPAIITQLGQWVGAFLGWILPMIPKLLLNLGTFIASLWTWITTTAVDVGAKALAMGKSLLDGIVKGVQGLGGQLWDFLVGVLNSIWSQITSFFTGGGTANSSSAALPGLGGKASGGPVTGGTPYLVGERGPELFMPSSNGSIIPNGQLGGGGLSIGNVYITAGLGANGAQIASDFLEELNAQMSAAGRVRRAGI